MDTLFGIPTNQLTLVLLGVFAAGALILAGLMLATVLFSAAFTTGDTLTNSLRTQALENIGRVDVVVKAKQPESESAVAFGPGAGAAEAPDARERYFDAELVDAIRNRLADDDSVAGVAPLAKETVPVSSPDTDLSEPQVDVLGMDPDASEGFDRLKTASGTTLVLEDLNENEVYVSAKTAEELGVSVGDKVEASLIRPTTEPRSETPSEPQRQQRPGTAQRSPAGSEGRNPPVRVGGGARPTGSEVEARAAEATREQRPPELKIAGIYESGANPASDASMVMQLGELQKLVGEKASINEVLITHRGPTIEGAAYTKETVDEIKPVLTANNLQADPVKKDAVEGADTRGEIFFTLFVLFGQFSVAAGMLLIFLIFVMLAAERKKELGIARAVGMQRSNLIRTFVFEGALYALAAGALGSVAGVGVGWVMVRLIGRGFAGGSEDFRIAFATSAQNVVLAFCMGMVLTFIVVLVSSWRVSRLNVVRAIRDIPEPDTKGRSVQGAIMAVLVPLAGAIAFWQAFATQLAALYLGGLSLMLIGLAL